MGLQGSLRLFRTQIIIVIYLSVVGALLLYVAFLMLVDPLIRKPDAYTERLHNEEENEVPAPGATPPVPLPMHGILGHRAGPTSPSPLLQVALLFGVQHVTPVFPQRELPCALPGAWAWPELSPTWRQAAPAHRLGIHLPVTAAFQAEGR